MSTSLVRLIAVCLLIGMIAGAGPVYPDEPTPKGINAVSAGVSYARPRDPWVFTGSLDDRSRILFVALHHDLWVAYDTELGALYKGWRGALLPASNDPNAFSPWPASIDGITYFSQENEVFWRIIRNGEVSTPEVHFRGYRLAGDRLTLRYELVSEYGHRIVVEESPEVVHTTDERPGLQREFFVDQLPPGVQVALDVEMTQLRERTDVQTDGTLQRTGARTHAFVWGKTYDISGRLILTPAAATTLTTWFAPNILKNLENDSALDPLELFRDTRVYRAMDLGDEASASSRLLRRQDHQPGVAVKVYGIGESIDSLMQLAPGQLPTSYTIEPAINLTNKSHFGDLDFYFITHVTGFLNIASEGEYSFRVMADDGIRFSIDHRVLYEHNGLQAAEPSETFSIDLKPGIYPFAIEHFQSTGQKQLTLEWKPPWRTAFEVLESPVISTKKEEQRRHSVGKKYVLRQVPDALIELERVDVAGLHPGLEVETLEINQLMGSIGGMDKMSDGRFVVATWNGDGSVYLVDGIDDPGTGLQATAIAKGLSYPFGIKVIDDEVFVLQKHELTQLSDLDGDGRMDEYRVVANDWALTNDFEELAFGLAYREGQFYTGLSVPLDSDGAILIEEIPDRGQLVRIGFDGTVERISGGFQVPNGITLDPSGMFVAVDHRNPWFSDSRLLLVGENLPGSGQTFQPAAASPASPLQMSSIWLPSGAKTEAPTQPLRLDNGPFQGQWLYGDLKEKMLNRVFVEQVNGILQGAVFRFTNGLPAPIHRLLNGSDDSIIAGSMGFSSQWRSLTSNAGLLHRIRFNDAQVFEMQALRIKSDGFEIEFTKPVDAEFAETSASYRVYRWENHARDRRRRRDRSIVEEVEVANVRLSEDGQHVSLELEDFKAGALYYINLDPSMLSVSGEKLWSNEVWYTVNERPEVIVGKND